jgi:MSHA pilin protein MshC
LILVIVVLGTLSYFAVARLADRGDTDAHGFAEQLASTLRFAQKAAVAQRRNVFVNVDGGAGRVWVCLDAAPACTTPLAAPAGGPLEHNTPRGVSVATGGAAQIVFDALGRPSLASALDLTVTASAATFTVRIEPDSGYVRRL